MRGPYGSLVFVIPAMHLNVKLSFLIFSSSKPSRGPWWQGLQLP